MSPRDAARVYGFGRAGIGALMLVAPRLAIAPFFGRRAAQGPGVSALVRTTGVRDLVIGMIAVHTLDHPDVAPRWQRACAAIDAVDGLAVLAARRELPTAGVAGFLAIAGGGAAAGAWLSGQVGRAEPAAG